MQFTSQQSTRVIHIFKIKYSVLLSVIKILRKQESEKSKSTTNVGILIELIIVERKSIQIASMVQESFSRTTEFFGSTTD